jgi:hypothetical protein
MFFSNDIIQFQRQVDDVCLTLAQPVDLQRRAAHFQSLSLEGDAQD